MLQPPSVHNKISAVDPVGSFLILFFLDHQGGLRTARTRTERLVPYESEAKEGI